MQRTYVFIIKASLEIHDSRKENGLCESHFMGMLLKHGRNTFAVSIRFPEITTNILKICVLSNRTEEESEDRQIAG